MRVLCLSDEQFDGVVKALRYTLAVQPHDPGVSDAQRRALGVMTLWETYSTPPKPRGA